VKPDRARPPARDGLHERATELLIEGVTWHVPVQLDAGHVDRVAIRSRVLAHVHVRKIPGAIGRVVGKDHALGVFGPDGAAHPVRQVNEVLLVPGQVLAGNRVACRVERLGNVRASGNLLKRLPCRFVVGVQVDRRVTVEPEAIGAVGLDHVGQLSAQPIGVAAADIAKILVP
jgi:hypothetical protein